MKKCRWKKNAYLTEWQLICDQCQSWLPFVDYNDMPIIARKNGWYRIYSPAKNRMVERDICNQCAKKYRLADL